MWKGKVTYTIEQNKKTKIWRIGEWWHSKKLYDLEKERDKLMAEIKGMKDEIMMMESIKIENLENRENYPPYMAKKLLMKQESPLRWSRMNHCKIFMASNVS